MSSCYIFRISISVKEFQISQIIFFFKKRTTMDRLEDCRTSWTFVQSDIGQIMIFLEFESLIIDLIL